MNYKKLGKIPLADLLLLLHDKAPELFAEIKPRTNWGTTSWSGSDKVSISQSLAQRIDDWLVAQEPPQPKYVDRFKEETAELIEREGKRIRGEREAQARLQEYAEQGLLDSEYNATMIANFIKEHAVLKGQFTRAAVDVAVDFLGPKGSGVLQWRPKVVAPPPTATPKVWRPGDPLPDEATEYQLRHSSLDDVKAWTRRKQGS